MKTPRLSSRLTLLLALLCALLAHGCLLLWRGWAGHSVDPVQRLSVELVKAPGTPAAAPTAATTAPAASNAVVPDVTPKNQQSKPLTHAAPLALPAPPATDGDGSPHANSPAVPAPASVQNAPGVEATAVAGDAGSAQGSATESARILFAPKPPLPESARKRGETGTVVLRIQINEQGTATVSVQQTSGSTRLDESARSAVQQNWRFAPAQQDGRKVAGEIIQPVEFRLTD